VTEIVCLQNNESMISMKNLFSMSLNISE